MASFTPYQWSVLVLLILCKFLSTIVWSLQAPFYPAEAERKNATPIESGVVLGSYEIMVFIMCPLIASQLPKIGAFKAYHFGFVLCALSTICFGFLDKINDRIIFIGLSLMLRLLEATGSSAVFLAMYMLANRLYPGNVATVFGIIESTFAISMATGPPFGGILFELGEKFGFGFTLPFFTVGMLMLFLCLFTFPSLPKDTIYSTESMTKITENEVSSPSFGFFGLLKIRKVLVYSLAGMSGALCVGFLTGTLGLHLAQFHLTHFMTGMMFFIYGGAYAATGFLWGILCDRLRRPEFATLIGSILILVSMIFLGPVHCVPLESSLALTGASLACFGIGLGGIYVSVYSLILKEARANGFPESGKTSAIVAGLWMEGISLGAFIGPILGGVLLHNFTFETASLAIIAIFIILSIILAVSIFTTANAQSVDDHTVQK